MDSSDNEDPIHYIFTIWCSFCSHPFHSKQHGSAHFKLCPSPHNILCGCCGNQLPWKAAIRHLNNRHATYKGATVTQAPSAIDSTYDVTCVKIMPSCGQHRFSPHARAASAWSSASHSTVVVSDTSASSPTPLSPTPLSPTMLRRRTPLPSLHQPHPTPTYHFHHHLVLQHHLRLSLITRTFLSHAIQFHHLTSPTHLIQPSDTTSHGLSNEEKTKCPSSPVQKLRRGPEI